jgi:trans-aconitate 2-methyltransferase
MTWSAKQYSTFEEERTRPVRDLVAAIPSSHVRVAVDLGCGPGNSTEVLAQRFPDAVVTGLDSSEDMIIAARARLPDMPFALADIAQWQPEQAVDVILANASLQWLPDHASLYPRLMLQVAPNGSFAVQTPDNLAEPAHVLAREVASEGPWASKTGSVRHPDRHNVQFYYDLLRPLSRAVDVWKTTYHHPLANAEAVVEWFKGSALRPYLAKLDEDEQRLFLQRYLDAIKVAYPASQDGTVLLPFPRLFVVARK